MNRQIEIEKLAAETTSDPRWLLLVARDKESDGKFFYSVKTTGGILPSVVCRSPCTSRKRALLWYNCGGRESGLPSLQTM